MASGAFTTIDRRSLLAASLSALAGCATAPAPQADAEFRDFVARLADRSRTARPFLLQRFDRARLTAQGQILYDAIAPGIDADAGLARSVYGRNGYPYVVSQRNGLHLRAASLTSRDAALDYARAIDRETGRLEADAARGVVAPACVLEAAIAEVQTARERAVAADFERLDEALTRQIVALHGLRPRAADAPGVWRLPDGDAYYALTLQFHLGAPADAREAHAQALEQCQALQSEADALLRAHGLTSGSVGERLRALATDDRQLYANSSDGKAAAVADMNAQLQRTRALLGDAFAGLDLPDAEIRALPRRLESGGAQGRRSGAIYYVDLGAIRTRPRWSLPSVVHHEAVPGHIALAPFMNDAAPAALQQRYAGGYQEGWAIYAEQLAAKSGAFERDPLARLGYLQWRLFRMARIVADTGIHGLRWSRAEAMQQMHALQGGNVAFVTIADDVTRMCAQPGLYAAQGLAALHLADLRARTMRGHSAARFHAAVLRHGPLSPPGLEQAIRADA